MSLPSSIPEDTKYWIALDRVSGLGPKKFNALERAFPTMKQAWNTPGGALTEAGGRSVAVIGTRQASTRDREACKVLSDDLALNGVTVVSGMATRHRRHRHAAPLDAGGCTIAVLGSGLDRIY